MISCDPEKKGEGPPYKKEAKNAILFRCLIGVCLGGRSRHRWCFFTPFLPGWDIEILTHYACTRGN